MRTHYVLGDSGTLWMGLLAIDHTDHPRHQVILIGGLPGRGSRASTNGSLSSSRPPADTYQLRTQCCSGAKQRATSKSWPGPQESMRSVSSYSSSRAGGQADPADALLPDELLHTMQGVDAWPHAACWRVRKMTLSLPVGHASVYCPSSIPRRSVPGFQLPCWDYCRTNLLLTIFNGRLCRIPLLRGVARWPRAIVQEALHIPVLPPPHLALRRGQHDGTAPQVVLRGQRSVHRTACKRWRSSEVA